MKRIVAEKQEEYLQQAVTSFKQAKKPAALTGAGISVGSGIADFRSKGGLWSIFSPDEYATLDVFLHNPAKAWKLYRELGRTLVGKKPNSGHQALATLEAAGLLQGIVTQNIDNLHQAAGNSRVIEIHGDHQHLQCLQCDSLVTVSNEHYSSQEIPCCPTCQIPYKPNIVLFGEAVRSLDEIEALLFGCDLLLVIGTSAKVYPAASLPAMVKQQGGLIYEFNLDPALGVSSPMFPLGLTDYFFDGDLISTLPYFTEAVLK